MLYAIAERGMRVHITTHAAPACIVVVCVRAWTVGSSENEDIAQLFPALYLSFFTRAMNANARSTMADTPSTAQHAVWSLNL